jgi:hypothetical protein
MRTFVIVPLGLILLTILPQLPAQTPQRQTSAEKIVVETFVRMRHSAGLPALKVVQPSKAEVQLVCTAAATGKFAEYGELIIYVTEDPGLESPELKRLATNKFGPTSENGFTDKEWPRFSVVVFLDSSSDGRLRYRVGINRRVSRFGEVIDRFFAEDYSAWKNEISPACKAATQ